MQVVVQRNGAIRLMNATLAERLAAHTSPGENGCVIWTGRLTTRGYGQMKVDGKKVQAHRVAYELAVGPIPEGKQLDHLCRVRACVNPDHLEPVTQKENILRGVAPTALNAVKTSCSKGHEYTPANTYRYPNGERDCRTCRAARRHA